MTKRLLSKLFFAAALVTPLLPAGCADPAVVAKSAPPAAREAAQPGAPPAPTTAEKALRDLATDADPRVQVAVLTAASLRESERRLDAVFSKYKPKLDSGRLGKDWQTKEFSHADFQRACRVLREMAEDLEAAHLEFVLVSDRYEEQLARGPPAYRVAAAYFQERSVKAAERLFRDGYAELAVYSERFAVLVEERKKTFARFRAEVTESRAYAKKSARYIRDVEGFAGLTPNAEGADVRASYRSFLLVYVRSFNEFLDLTAGFTDTLKARPLPAPPPETPPGGEPGYTPGGNRPAPTLAFSYVNYARAADADAAAIEQAVRKGETSVRYVRETVAEYAPLKERLGRYKGKSVPPALEAEFEDYERRVAFTRSAGGIVVNDAGSFAIPAGLSPGVYLPVIRDHQAKRGGPFFIGVVKVEAVSGDRATLRAVRGKPLDGDVALYWPVR